MSHLLVTRYSVKEDFGVEKGLKKLDDIEAKVKETGVKINKEIFLYLTYGQVVKINLITYIAINQGK